MPEQIGATIAHGDYRLGNMNHHRLEDSGGTRLGALHPRRPARGRWLPAEQLGLSRRSFGRQYRQHPHRCRRLPNARGPDRALRPQDRSRPLTHRLLPSLLLLARRRHHRRRLPPLHRRLHGAKPKASTSNASPNPLPAPQNSPWSWSSRAKPRSRRPGTCLRRSYVYLPKDAAACLANARTSTSAAPTMTNTS